MGDRFVRCEGCGGVNRVREERVASGPKCGRCQRALDLSGHPQVVGDAALAELVRKSPVPVLVDFYADWCAPCRALAPTLAKLGAELSGRLLVVKVDTERDGQTAAQLGVRGIPAVFLFKGGQVVAQETGARPLEHWRRWVAPHLG